MCEPPTGEERIFKKITVSSGRVSGPQKGVCNMKKAKRWISLLMAAILTVSLAACSGIGTASQTSSAQNSAAGDSTSGTASAGRKVLTLSDGELEGGFDPAGFALGGWVSFARLCSAPLISFDNEGNEIMETAESYSVSDDRLVWTFKLRNNAKWSDGSDVTAADFINTIRRALDPETSQSIYADQLYVHCRRRRLSQR